MTDVASFLSEVAARPLEWGRCDCCLMLADWIAARLGVDPAADLRATYADAQGAADAVAAEGGLAALFERRLARIGLVRTDTPEPGDVAVVTIDRRQDMFGAIAAETGWAMKTTRGLVVSRVPRPVACWTFADG